MKALKYLTVLALLASCSTTWPPEEALRLYESTDDMYSIQTHTMSSPSEMEILAASNAVLQDMEFSVDYIDRSLGVITASKMTDADSMIEQAGLVALDFLCAVAGGLAGSLNDCNNFSSAGDEQNITLTMVVLPSIEGSDEHSVRVTLQRTIYDRVDRIKSMEQIVDAEVYQQFFDNLQKSLFKEVGDP